MTNIHYLQIFWVLSEWWSLNTIRRTSAASFPLSKFGTEHGHLKITSDMFLFTMAFILKSQEMGSDFWFS